MFTFVTNVVLKHKTVYSSPPPPPPIHNLIQKKELAPEWWSREYSLTMRRRLYGTWHNDRRCTGGKGVCLLFAELSSLFVVKWSAVLLATATASCIRPLAARTSASTLYQTVVVRFNAIDTSGFLTKKLP